MFGCWSFYTWHVSVNSRGLRAPDLNLRLARPLAAKQLDRYFKHIGVRSFILYGAPMKSIT